MTTPQDQIDSLLVQLENAILTGDTAEITRLTALLQALQDGGTGQNSSGILTDVKQTHNFRLSPITPHGDQNVQTAVWKPEPSICGKCTCVPRYWSLEFDFSEQYSLDPEGSYDHFFGTGKLWNDYKLWFRETVVKRGPLIHEPFGAPGEDVAGNYWEAAQARFEVEYTYAYWKSRIPIYDKYAPNSGVWGNGLNVAWFLWYGQDPTPGDVPSPETDIQGTDANWRLAVVENQRIKPTGGGTTWTNAYAPLLVYQLVPRNRDAYEVTDDPRIAMFECMGTNRWELTENYLNLPKHLLTMKAFYP